MGETHIMLSRDKIELASDALVVNELDVEFLAGIPFMSTNDISVRPAKQQNLTPTLFSMIPLHQTHLTVCVVHKRIYLNQKQLLLFGLEVI